MRWWLAPIKAGAPPKLGGKHDHHLLTAPRRSSIQMHGLDLRSIIIVGRLVSDYYWSFDYYQYGVLIQVFSTICLGVNYYILTHIYHPSHNNIKQPMWIL